MDFLFIDRVGERRAALIIGVDIAGRPGQATVALVERLVGSRCVPRPEPSRRLEGRRSVSVVNTSWRKTVSDGCHRSAVATTVRSVCTIRRWCVYAVRVCIYARSLRNSSHECSCIRTCLRAYVRTETYSPSCFRVLVTTRCYNRGIAQYVHRKCTPLLRLHIQLDVAPVFFGPGVVHRGVWSPHRPHFLSIVSEHSIS